MAKDWEYKEIETGVDKYKMLIAVIVAISLGIPAYIYATGMYIEPSQTLDTLVDDGLYNMSAPIQLTWELGVYSDADVYENYVAWRKNVAGEQIYLYNIDTNDTKPMGWSIEALQYPEIWGNYVGYNSYTTEFKTYTYDIDDDTNNTLDEPDLRYPHLWENYLVAENGSGITPSIYLYNIDTETNETIVTTNSSTAVFKPRIHEGNIVFREVYTGVIEPFRAVCIYNMENDTKYYIWKENVTSIMPYEWFIWGDMVLYSTNDIGGKYVYLYDISTSQTTNISELSPIDSVQRSFLSISENICVWQVYDNGTWKLECYDIETGNFFYPETAFLSTSKADVYVDESGDAKIVFQSGTWDIYLIYLNSTAEEEPIDVDIDVDGDGMPDIQQQELMVYNYDMIYIALISATIGTATIIFYAIEKRKERNAN